MPLDSDLMQTLNSNIRSLLNGSEKIRYGLPVQSLLTGERLDVMIKAVYAKAVVAGHQNCFSKKLYLKHISAINGFVEMDDTSKVGKNDFLESFHELIVSAQSDGHLDRSLIPIGAENTLIDGAHRLAVALALGIETVNTIQLDIPGQVYDVQFFLDHGFSEYEVDYIVLEYARIKKSLKCIIFWPASQAPRKGRPSLSKIGVPVYWKPIQLSCDGMVNAVQVAYEQEKWLGDSNDDYMGTRNKARWCSSGESEALICFFDQFDSVDLVKAKAMLREQFGLKEHSLHINDHHHETVSLGELFLNSNSISWANSAKVTRPSELVASIREFRRGVESSGGDLADNIILGSSKALYGIGKFTDLDYSNRHGHVLAFNSAGIEYEREKLNYIPTHIDELLDNPSHYFYYLGCKCLSLANSCKIKSERGRDSDLEDLEVMIGVLHGLEPRTDVFSFLHKWSKLRSYRLAIKSIAYRVRYTILVVLSKLNLR